ncbi:MAG: ATP-binding protein [Phycisphaerales bacterium]
MGARTREFDWASTSLGPPRDWPQPLQTAVSVMLNSRYPMFIWWGAEELIYFYNDAYIPILGARHPHALGRSARDIWPDIWSDIGPLADTVFERGRATWNEELLLIMERHGYPEETYFTFSYSPIPDPAGGIAGLFCACTEETERVLSARRLRTLRQIASATAEARSAETAAKWVTDTLADNRLDVPFAFFYLLDPEHRKLTLAGSSGIEAASVHQPREIELGDSAAEKPMFPVDAALEKDAVLLLGLRDSASIHCEPWPESIDTAIMLPLGHRGQEAPAGVIVLGASPRRPFDDAYREFFDLIADAASNAVANARAHDEERQRAESLAELDRAKTAFFSNVSHEFRTPLTLMFGPLEDALKHPETDDEARKSIDLALRNGRRLLKLVNTLLDFSRIEAGRVQACYEPVDLSALTAELAAVFRSAIERAGLKLRVDCPPVSEPVFVDRDMWEKIVLNLLSNALKFTLEGEIEVSLVEDDRFIRLRVRDTGVGIPEEELPRLFERFHRIEGSGGRTHEGTGIGLALVQELARLHGGAVSATSTLDRGTTLEVTIPRGRAHLPADRIGATRSISSTALGADPYIQEAMRWLPGAGDEPNAPLASEAPSTRPARGGLESPKRVLVADDNADMRDYLRRLLGDRYEVQVAADGVQALQLAREFHPDLIISDIMMPRLDGFGLMRELREDAALGTAPIILLSARAGEESRIEGIQAGADDYMVKPFGARELLARVEAHLKMAELRRETENRFRAMADTAPAMLWITNTSGDCTYLSAGWTQFTGQRMEEGLELGWTHVIHPDDQERSTQIFLDANADPRPFQIEYRLRDVDGNYRWVIDAGRPRFAEDGEFLGFIGSVIDIDDRKRHEEQMRLVMGELNHRVKNTLAGVQAIASQTLRHSASIDDFMVAFSDRIRALADAHSLLTRTQWEGVAIDEVLKSELLARVGSDDQFSLRGPSIVLRPKASLALHLVVHELCTNASKYGSLTSSEGVVEVEWGLETSNGQERFVLEWRERNGPEVRAPDREGFGNHLLRRTIQYELDGAASAEFDPHGVSWTIEIPFTREIGYRAEN